MASKRTRNRSLIPPNNNDEPIDQELSLIPCITVADILWNTYISDVGCALDDPSKSKCYKADDGRKYKEIWKLSNYLWNRMEMHRERFPRLPKSNSKTESLRRIGKIIYTERILVDDKFQLDQEVLHMKLKVAYGLANETSNITVNDHARAFGLLTDPDFEVERIVLLGMQSTRREVVDDPTYNMRNCCIRLMQAMADTTKEISSPNEWANAMNLEGYDDLNPNDTIRIQNYNVNRDSLFFKKNLIDPILPIYRKTCIKYRSDTGNGSGQPENFTDWDPREDINFAKFTGGQSPALYTWIFMKDRQLGYILEGEKDNIPDHIQACEGVIVDEESSLATPSRYQGKTPPKSKTSKQLEALTSASSKALTDLSKMIKTYVIKFPIPSFSGASVHIYIVFGCSNYIIA